MSYRIPTEYQIVEAIQNVMFRTPVIKSQDMLCELVTAELRRVDETYRVSAERIRKVGIKNDCFIVDLKYAHEDGPFDIEECPVCGSRLTEIRNRTLYWESVNLTRRCNVCGYAATSDASRPHRYTITRKDTFGNRIGKD